VTVLFRVRRIGTYVGGGKPYRQLLVSFIVAVRCPLMRWAYA